MYQNLEASQRKETCGREWMEGLAVKLKDIMAAPIWQQNAQSRPNFKSILK